LHVDDFVVADREDLEAFVATSVGGEPLGRADDLVSELGELGLDFDAPLALGDLELQDLTGLVGAVSGRGALPPEVAVRDAAPLVLLSDQRGERFRISVVEGFGGCAETIDHLAEYEDQGARRQRLGVRF